MISLDSLEGVRGEEEHTSLYQRILNDIRAKIVSGEWPPGYRIPFEHELTLQYGCSRMTVNKAMSQLAKSGSDRTAAALRQFCAAAAQPGRHPGNPRHPHRSRSAWPCPIAMFSPCEKSGKAQSPIPNCSGPMRPKRLLELKCMHLANERPFCIEERLISLDAVPEAASERFVEIAPGPWLIGRVPWSSAEHRISAAGANPEIAAALDIDDGAPCLVIERRTWSADRPVTHACFSYAAESHSLVARFSPNDGG